MSNASDGNGGSMSDMHSDVATETRTQGQAADGDSAAARGEGHPNQYDVFVAYNGVDKSMMVNVHETVQAVLNRAIHEFRITAQPHLLSLYNMAGGELPDSGQVGEVGVRPGDHLLLRPGAVKGGSAHDGER